MGLRRRSRTDRATARPPAVPAGGRPCAGGRLTLVAGQRRPGGRGRARDRRDPARGRSGGVPLPAPGGRAAGSAGGRRGRGGLGPLALLAAGPVQAVWMGRACAPTGRCRHCGRRGDPPRHAQAEAPSVLPSDVIGVVVNGGPTSSCWPVLRLGGDSGRAGDLAVLVRRWPPGPGGKPAPARGGGRPPDRSAGAAHFGAAPTTSRSLFVRRPASQEPAHVMSERCAGPLLANRPAGGDV
jgi:hypothetical protein